MSRLSIPVLVALSATAVAAPPPITDVDEPELLSVPVDADGTWRPVLAETALPGLDPDDAELLLEALAARAPLDALTLEPHIETWDGVVPLESYFPEPTPVPDKEPPLRGRPVDHPGAADGALSGKAVYLSQCHGYRYSTSLGRFGTQRPNLFDTVEDFHNPEGMNQFLRIYLENSGAKVFTAKERDHQSNEVILDDGQPGYSETGNGFRDGLAGFGERATYRYGENPFRTGGTRLVDASSGAVATWTATVPEDGSYAIYVSWDSDPGNASDAHYRITHPGGTIDRRFDQRVHGSTWQYVEQLWLSAEAPVTIELIADSEDRGATLSIDAVRIGGGIANIERYGRASGVDRWEDAAVQYVQFNGAPTSVYDPSGDGANGSDPSSRSRWADWEHPQGEDALYLSWHSNATATGGARGTVTYIYEGSRGEAYPGSSALAWAVQEEMIDAFQMNWEPAWRDIGVKKAAFSEVNPSHNNEMPAALVELAFHDNPTDIAYLKHPRFRLDASRAMYRGIVRYFAERDGERPVYLPEPPVALSAVHDENGRIRLSWSPGQVGAPFGDAPTGYLVQTSTDGRAWTEPVGVTGTSTLLDVARGQQIFARVIAENEGGHSFASEVVGALRSPDGQPAVLVVDAFDRFETGQLEWEDALWSVGPVRRMNAARVNPHEIVVSHGLAVGAAGWPFDSVSDEALDGVDLSTYQVVVWAAGEESTVDETVSDSQQDRLRAFWEAGGALWLSGAEVLWDLDAKGSSADKDFAAAVLGATLANDDAGTERVLGVGLLEGLDLRFDASDAPYPVEWPDVLASERPVIARYEGGGTAGVLGERVALFGVPFEAMHGGAGRGDELRAEVAYRVLTGLSPDYTPPEGVQPGTRSDNRSVAGLVADDPRAPIPAGGCACATAGDPHWGWLLMVGMGLLWRRRSPVR